MSQIRIDQMLKERLARPASGDDLAAVQRMVLAFVQQEGNTVAVDAIFPQRDLIFVVEEQAGGVVGAIVASKDENAQVANIKFLYVSGGFRLNQIGRTLLGKLVEKVGPGIELRVEKCTLGAQGFFKRAGFKPGLEFLTWVYLT
jgi:N-acetylglutamate synthase-like GNAT family acetyltransferase